MAACMGQCGAESRRESEMAVFYCLKQSGHSGRHHFSYQGLEVPDDEATLRTFAQDVASFMWSQDCGSTERTYLMGIFERHGLISQRQDTKRLEATKLLTGESA